jgi:hypothetical protein
MQQSVKCQVGAPLRLPRDQKTVRAKKREISIRYAWAAYKRDGKISKSRMMTLVRLRELERLYAARQCLIDDDAGREYIGIAAHHIAHLGGEVERHVIAWCQRWASWLPIDEARDLGKRVSAKPRKWKADSLAREVNLTAAERAALNITTIGAVDQTKRQRTEAAKERRSRRDRKRNELMAAAEGRILRARPGRPRKTSVPMWEKLGMSRASWYRNGKPSETNILTTQGIIHGGCEFPSQGEPSRSAVCLGQDGNVVAYTTAAQLSRYSRRGRDESLKEAA